MLLFSHTWIYFNKNYLIYIYIVITKFSQHLNDNSCDDDKSK